MNIGKITELLNQLDIIGSWGIIVTDASLKIVGWNRWLERQTGHSADSAINRPLFEVFPELSTRRMEKYYHQALQGQPVMLSQALHKYLILIPPLTSDKRFNCMQQTTRITPFKQEDTIVGTITFIEDVTERVSYEGELKERLEALREADKRKDEFLAMLAHELRNPLAPIHNAVQILYQTGRNDPTSEHAVNIIQRQVEHMVRLVDDLLDVSRVSRGKIQLQKGIIDLMLVVKQAIETSKSHIESRGHELRLEVPAAPILIEGDYTRLSQVIGNLLNNAAKYTESGGTLHLSVDLLNPVDNPRVEIRVRDTGRGIEKSALTNLFDLFYQVDRNLDRSEGGLGIGLSLVKNLVEMHGGTVEAKSAGRDQGSEFIVTLPALKSDTKVDPLPPQTIVINSLQKLRILVVDDNLDAAESMALLLEMDSHEVWTAHDGKQAVQIALEKRPDIIFLDIGLPLMNGYQVCQAIRDGGLKDNLIVALTGYGMEEDLKHSSKSGFNAHVVKPAEHAQVKSLLADWTKTRFHPGT